MKVAFVTDSGTGKTVSELKQDGIFSVPLQVSYDNTNYQDLEELGIEEMYRLMRDGVMLSTSLPSLGKIEALFEHLKNEGYEQIFAVPICTGLSGTINAMQMCAKTVGIPFDYVDCNVTAVVQDYMIHLAKDLHEKGKSISEIKAVLETVVDSTNTYLLPNDLHHLKRGGRLTPLAATLGGLLKIKPILTIQGEKLDSFQKTRTMQKAAKIMIEALRHDIQERIDPTHEDMSDARIMIAYTYDRDQALEFKKEVEEAFPNHDIICDPLSLSVACHIGPHSLAIAACKKI